MSEDPPISVSVEGGRRVVSWQVDEAGHMVLTHDYPDAVNPHYLPSSIDEDVLLYTGEFWFDNTGSPFRGNVWWRWGSPPRIEAVGHRPTTSDDLFRAIEGSGSQPPLWRHHDQLAINFTDGVLPSQPSVPDGSPQASHFIVAPVEQHLGDGARLDSVRFLIPNGFHSSDCTGICDPNDLAKTWHGRTIASGDGWEITIDRLQSMDHEQWKLLRSRRGRTFTHIAELRRTEGALFSDDEAFVAMDRVRIALNVALGRRTTCALPVGYLAEEPVWCRWRSAPVDHYTAASHWLDESISSSQISAIVSDTLAFTSTPVAYSTLKGAVSYYMAANNDVTVELTLPLVVSALQMLSYYRFVVEADDESGLSKTKWKELGTEGQLRSLLTDAKIDLAIPATYTSLQNANRTVAAERQGGDALWIVVKMRNVAAHPTKELPYETFDIYEWGEAGILARRWLCLSILKTVGYAGLVSRRDDAGPHWTGSVTRPPWIEE